MQRKWKSASVVEFLRRGALTSTRQDPIAPDSLGGKGVGDVSLVFYFENESFPISFLLKIYAKVARFPVSSQVRARHKRFIGNGAPKRRNCRPPGLNAKRGVSILADSQELTERLAVLRNLYSERGVGGNHPPRTFAQHCVYHLYWTWCAQHGYRGRGGDGEPFAGVAFAERLFCQPCA